jgi:hypothetical protein
MKNTEKNTERATRKIPGPTLSTKPVAAPGIRRADAGVVR